MHGKILDRKQKKPSARPRRHDQMTLSIFIDTYLSSQNMEDLTASHSAESNTLFI